jgi:DNA-binding LytR/AlgR family response regulator
MLNCIILDDEEHACQLLKTHVEKVPFLCLKAVFTDAIQALAYLQQEDIDLIFLDIQMPELSGIQVLEIINGKYKVIITSAYTEYALLGYEHDVVDYLVKPISLERLFKAARKAINNQKQPLPLTSPGEVVIENNLILVKSEVKGKLFMLDINDIFYVEGMKNYVSFYTATERIMPLLNMKDLEQYLPANKFVRVHKSFIVNIFKIQSIEGNQISLQGIEKNQKKIPIGVTYKDAFFQKIEKYIMGKK